MSLADITTTIMAEAGQEAEKIKAETKVKLTAKEAEWAEKVKVRQAEIIAGVKNKANQKVLQSRFNLQAKANAEILKAKRKVIDEVYQVAYQDLGQISDKDYVDLMVKLLEEIKAAEGSLISAAGKENLLKKSLQKTGQQFKLLNETTKDIGGFIFRSPALEIDNTFSRLVADSKDRTMLEVTSIIFKKD